MSDQFLTHDWFPAPLPANVEIGPRSWLYSTYAFRHYRSEASTGLRVGCDTGLYHGTFFDLGRQAHVEIGNFCTLVGVIVATNGDISIGDYGLLAHEVVIAQHDYWAPCGAYASAPHRSAGPDHRVSIGENVWIGARAVLVGNLTIGDNAVVGAAALVAGDVPPNCIFAGNPGRVVGRVAGGKSKSG